MAHHMKWSAYEVSGTKRRATYEESDLDFDPNINPSTLAMVPFVGDIHSSPWYDHSVRTSNFDDDSTMDCVLETQNMDQSISHSTNVIAIIANMLENGRYTFSSTPTLMPPQVGDGSHSIAQDGCSSSMLIHTGFGDRRISRFLLMHSMTNLPSQFQLCIVFTQYLNYKMTCISKTQPK